MTKEPSEQNGAAASSPSPVAALLASSLHAAPLGREPTRLVSAGVSMHGCLDLRRRRSEQISNTPSRAVPADAPHPPSGFARRGPAPAPFPHSTPGDRPSTGRRTCPAPGPSCPPQPVASTQGAMPSERRAEPRTLRTPLMRCVPLVPFATCACMQSERPRTVRSMSLRWPAIRFRVSLTVCRLIHLGGESRGRADGGPADGHWRGRKLFGVSGGTGSPLARRTQRKRPPMKQREMMRVQPACDAWLKMGLRGCQTRTGTHRIIRNPERARAYMKSFSLCVTPAKARCGALRGGIRRRRAVSARVSHLGRPQTSPPPSCESGTAGAWRAAEAPCSRQ